MEGGIRDDMLEFFGNIRIDIGGIDLSLQAVDGQGTAAGFQRKGTDVHHADAQLGIALGQHRADDAGTTAEVEQLAPHGGQAGQQHLAAEIQPVGAEHPGQGHDGQIRCPGPALIATEPGVQLERGDRLAELGMIEGAAAGGVPFDGPVTIGRQQLVGPVDAASVLARQQQIGTRLQQGGHHGQQVLRLGLGLGHQQQQGIEAGSAAELVIEQDVVAQRPLLAEVVAIIRREDRQASGQFGQLARIVILQGAADQ
ncbi:hypothetical protein D3C84_751090 [compost metagenome]